MDVPNVTRNEYTFSYLDDGFLHLVGSDGTEKTMSRRLMIVLFLINLKNTRVRKKKLWLPLSVRWARRLVLPSRRFQHNIL